MSGHQGHDLLPDLGAVPDVRVVEVVALLVLLRPGQQLALVDLVADGDVLGTQRFELGQHLGLHVHAGGEDHVGGLHLLDVLGGGFVGVGVAAGLDHRRDLGVGIEHLGRVGQVTGGREDRELLPATCALRGGAAGIAGASRDEGDGGDGGERGDEGAAGEGGGSHGLPYCQSIN